MTPADLTDDDLARTLEELRPEPAPGWARDMDAWARTGFAGADPHRPRARPRRRRPVLLRGPVLGGLAAAAAAAAIGVAVIPALPNGSDDEGPAGVSGTAAPSVRETAREPRRLQRASKPGGPRNLEFAPLTGAPQARRGRSVELSASLDLAAPPGELEQVAGGVARVTDAAGGYVARSTVEANPDGGLASFELRVPSRRLTTFLADLSELAAVRSRTQGTVDITRTVRSATERLQEGRAERRGLLRRLAQAPDDALRARLRRVNRRIADARGDLASANRRADLARVSVQVTGDPEAGAAIDDGRWTPGEALRDAGRVLEVAAGALLVALAIAVPLALLAAPALAAARRRRRLGRERALDAV